MLSKRAKSQNLEERLYHSIFFFFRNMKQAVQALLQYGIWIYLQYLFFAIKKLLFGGRISKTLHLLVVYFLR